MSHECKKCKFPEGISIRPDGKSELDPCFYEVIEAYRNVDVQILQCKNCGHIEVEWFRREDTEDAFDEVM